MEETLVEHAARQGSQANNQHETLVDVLCSEFHAAMSLMGHRERWWTDGMRSAESAIGMESGRVRPGKCLRA